MFAAISGDFDPIHMDEEYAKATLYGRRIVHGIATLGLMSAAESKISTRIVSRGGGGKPVSLGYDRIRFLKPVFIGDTLTATYTVAEVQPDTARAVGKCEITNQAGDLVVVGQHVFKWVS